MRKTCEPGPGENTLEFTILMPCLNEALTIKNCVQKAADFLLRENISGEILVADNGSEDGSQRLARDAGARVIDVKIKGYGSALMGGISSATGRFIIMADADDSYDFSDMNHFVDALRGGYELVIGNRFKGGIGPGAMPVLNRYVGNPVLSFVGRFLYSSKVGDFHCGMRGFEREAILKLDLKTSGMEFASEMVVKASLANLNITEVPTKLSPDGRQRAPHLRPWRDGWRHLRFLMLRSPQWLFLYPGLVVASFCLSLSAALTCSSIHIPGLFTLDINALLYSSVGTIVGLQIAYFGLFATALAQKMGIKIVRGFPEKIKQAASHAMTICVGVFLLICGVAGATFAIIQWGHESFGTLVPSEVMRITIPSVTTLAIGMQILFGGFLLGFIQID